MRSSILAFVTFVSILIHSSAALANTDDIADGTVWIRDIINDSNIRAEIKKSMKEKVADIERAIQNNPHEGHLLLVPIYKTSEGIKILGNGGNVQTIGSGKNELNAMVRYLKSDRLEPSPPENVLLSAEDSYLIWIEQKKGHIKYSIDPFYDALKQKAIKHIEADRKHTAKERLDRRAFEERESRQRKAEELRSEETKEKAFPRKTERNFLDIGPNFAPSPRDSKNQENLQPAPPDSSPTAPDVSQTVEIILP